MPKVAIVNMPSRKNKTSNLAIYHFLQTAKIKDELRRALPFYLFSLLSLFLYLSLA